MLLVTVISFLSESEQHIEQCGDGLSAERAEIQESGREAAIEKGSEERSRRTAV